MIFGKHYMERDIIYLHVTIVRIVSSKCMGERSLC